MFPAITIPHLAQVPLPEVQRLRLTPPAAEPVADVESAVWRELAASRRLAALPRGAAVAVAVGSRGVADIPVLARAVVGWLKDKALTPFIVPAMGSHGGGTAEGQAGVLAHLGVTEASVDAPVRATMETVVLGRTPEGIECRFDANAAGAAAVVVIARVKSHTSFDRPVESGLVKMVAVGLGKQAGARNVHRLGVRGYTEVLPALARIALGTAPLAYGIAVVENGRHELVRVEGVEPERFFAADERLLAEAKRLLARLPFRRLDALACELVGKEISGAGMDYAVIGRTDIRGVPNPEHIFINKIAVLGLSQATGGNGIGVGVADFMPKAAADQLDLLAMYMNCITATMVEKARIPVVLPTEREVVQALVATSWALEPKAVRYCQIRSTLHLEEILVTPELVPELAGRADAEVLGQPEPLRFTDDGRLLTRV
jgi:hypothetical protein